MAEDCVMVLRHILAVLCEMLSVTPVMSHCMASTLT
jgi:hypothetical protein